MPDLFISYSTQDRPWADRLYDELKLAYPTLDIFLDHRSLPPDSDWRTILVRTARDTRNLVVLWSDRARASNEVGPEIQAFEQARDTTPLVNGLPRTLFYVPLQGNYGQLTARQGFPKFMGLYDPTAQDSGVSKLDTPQHRPVLNESVRWIGDSITQYNPVTLAILTMNSEIVDLLDAFVNIRTKKNHPSLAELLSSLGLTLTDLKGRYGATAFDWRPFGTPETVIDIMEDARKDTNPGLDEEFRFQWKWFDLYAETTKAQAVEPVVQALIHGGPSVLLIDPIALHNILIKPIFEELGDYFKRQDAIVITLAPNQNPWLGSLLLSISEKAGPILKEYFKPLVPAAGTFAGCGLNLGHNMELRRLVRCGLGMYHLKRKRHDEGELVKMV